MKHRRFRDDSGAGEKGYTIRPDRDRRVTNQPSPTGAYRFFWALTQSKKEGKMKIKEAFELRRSLKEKIKEIQTELKDVENLLTSMIPPGETRANVAHIVTTGTSVSYAKAFNDALPQLSKKAQTILNESIANHTKSYDKHNFKENE